jgi:hypothetical protein
LKKKVLAVREISTEHEAHLINISTYKRNNALLEAKSMEREGVKISTAAEFYIKPTPIEISMLKEMKVEQIMTKK